MLNTQSHIVILGEWPGSAIISVCKRDYRDYELPRDGANQIITLSKIIDLKVGLSEL